MRPDDEKNGGDNGESNSPENGLNTWLALQRATDRKRANLIADIVGHPKGSPSVEELEYMNPPLSDDAIRRHLNTLAEVDVVHVSEFETGNRRRDFPYQFYELSSDARDLFDRNGLFPTEAWERQYQSVEKTARIKDVEAMPRPER